MRFDRVRYSIRGINPVEVLTGNSQEQRSAHAGPDEYPVEFLLFQEVVYRLDAAYHHVGKELDAHLLEFVDLGPYYRLGKTELGDAIYKHSAQFVQGLVYGHRDPLSLEHASEGQARGPGTDNSYLVSRRCGEFGHCAFIVGGGPVCHISFQAADGAGFAFLADYALGLALAFLRAHPTGDPGQAVLLFELPCPRQRCRLP